MSTDRRWYEPPTPRDWRRPSLTDLQRLQSSTSLRKAILERTSGTPADRILDRSSLKSSPSSGRPVIPKVDKSILDKSLRDIAANSPLETFKRTVRPPTGGNTRPASLRRNHSLANLNTTYIFRNYHGTDVFESDIPTTPSRPRSSSLTKYAPLPSISSAKNSPEFQPPPLIRSNTFEIIDTKMKDLPTVDDSKGDQCERWEEEDDLDPPYLVTVSIEGKTLPEYLTHARDGLLRSRPATRHGRYGGLAWTLEGTILTQSQFPIAMEFNEESPPSFPQYNDDKFNLSSTQIKDTECEHQRLPWENNESEIKSGLRRKEKDNSVTDDSGSDGCSNGSNSDDDDEEEEDEEEYEYEDEDPSDDNTDNNEDGNDDDNDMDNDDSEDEKDIFMEGEGSKKKYYQQELESLGNKEDIQIYFMLPDDSLRLVCTSPGWSLATLVGVVGGMRVGGRRMKVVLEGVQQKDLKSDLKDLGITHNTTIYLLQAD